MDKNQWISRKISLLEKENKGRSNQENLAIAMSMYNQLYKGQEGYELPKAQEAITNYYNLPANNSLMFPTTTYGASIPSLGQLPAPKNNDYYNRAFPNANIFGSKNSNQNYQLSGNLPVNPMFTQGISNSTPPYLPEGTVIPQTTSEVKPTEQNTLMPEVKSVSQQIPNWNPQPTDYEGQLQKLAELQKQQTGLNNQSKETVENQNYEIYNPYGGVGLDSSLYYAGQGFGSGNYGQAAIGTGLSILKGARNFLSGYGTAKATKESMDSAKQQQFAKNTQPIYLAQEGGKLTNGDVLTGAYVEESNTPNLEIEHGEYMRDPKTGLIQKAVGEKHKDGGIEVNAPQGAEILSNYTKVGASKAKELSKYFDVKVKPADTFSKVMDKINKKIGWDELVEEEKGYLKQLEKQEKLDTNKATKELNEQFLAKEIKEITDKKSELMQEQNSMFSKLFQVQESIPKKGDGTQILDSKGNPVKVNNKNVAQEGGTQKYNQNRGYGNAMSNLDSTLNTHSWYFDNEDKKTAFRQAALKEGSQKEVLDFQNAYNTEIIRRAKQEGKSEEEINRMLNQTGFTNKGSQKLDGKFGNFTSTRPMYEPEIKPMDLQYSPNTANIPYQQLPPQIEEPQLYRIQYEGQDMQGNNRYFTDRANTVIGSKIDDQGGLTQEQINEAKRRADLYNADLEKKYNNPEAKKNPKAQARYKQLKQGVTILPNYQEGGSNYDDNIMQLSNKYGIAPERVMELMQEGGVAQNAPQEQDQMQQIMAQVIQAIQQGADPNQIAQQLLQMGIPEEQVQQVISMAMQQGQEQLPMAQESIIPNNLQNQEQAQLEFERMKEAGYQQSNPYFFQNPGREGRLQDWIEGQDYKAEYELGDVQATATRFKELADNAGVSYTDADLKDMNSLNAFAGRLQEEIVKNKPELAFDYGLKVEPTRQGLQYLVDNKLINPKDYGIQIVDGKVARGSYDTLSTEAEQKIQQLISGLPEEKKKNYALTNYKDNLAYFRGVKTREQELSEDEYNKFTSDNKPVGGGYYATDVPGVYVLPKKLGSSGTTPEQLPAESNTPLDFTTPKQPLVDKNGRLVAPPLLPQDLLLPPSSLANLYKGEVRFGELDPTKITPEPMLVEAERQRQSATNQTYFLPDAQRASMIANTLGQTQMASNDAIGKAEMFNAQQQQQADQYNLQSQAKEDLTNLQLNTDFERRNLAGQAMYEANLRRYFNELNDQNNFNWNYIDRRNILNQGFENYKTSGSNVDFVNPTTFQNNK